MRHTNLTHAFQEAQLRAATRDAMAVELAKAEEAYERAKANYREHYELWEQAEAKARPLRPAVAVAPHIKLGVVP